MHGEGMMNGMGGMNLTMCLLMLLLLGFAILGIIVAVRWFINRGKTEREEFKHMKDDQE